MCIRDRAVNHALGQAFDEAQALLLQRLASISVASLAEDFDTRYRTLELPSKNL